MCHFGWNLDSYAAVKWFGITESSAIFAGNLQVVVNSR